MRASRLLAFVLATAAAPAAFSQLPAQDTVPGAQDNPLLSRFEGAKIVGYDQKAFDEATLIGSKPYYRNNQFTVDNALKVEGRYTRIVYNFAQERSALEVYRNYETALARAGLKTLFACAAQACGEALPSHLLGKRIDPLVKGGSQYREPFNWGRMGARYLVAKGVQADGAPVHVALLVVPPENRYNGGIYLEIVEGRPMEGGKVSATLHAADMAKRIAADGRVAVYGVYFDTDKATVKDASKDALAEMAKLLQQDPQLKVHIVGHTDNQGALAHNQELSQRRAQAVAQALATAYRIDPQRLGAHGVGPYAPVASNDTEAGREKNRRVELVKQ